MTDKLTEQLAKDLCKLKDHTIILHGETERMFPCCHCEEDAEQVISLGYGKVDFYMSHHERLQRNLQGEIAELQAKIKAQSELGEVNNQKCIIDETK